MSASVSPHGFEIVRGRGYRPEDVDRRFEGLSIDRDSCWERAARLTVLCNEMEAELTELRLYLAKLPPQTYESLGSEARLILTTAESEAARLRTEAEEFAERERDEADVHAKKVRESADKAASALRSDADERARHTEEVARDNATKLVAAASREAGQLRAEAAEALANVVRRTDQLLSEQEKRHAEEWDAGGREIAEREAALERLVAELDERGEVLLADERRRYAQAEEAARHHQEAAEDQGAELLAQARVAAERIERATERALREHDEEREELRAHMAHVRNSLAALTGKAPAPEDDGPAAGPAGPDEEDIVETQVPRQAGG
ncbi:cellulose-binding protein [Streptomyces sp. N2A]|uniref:cellulose-binding protein n=1 Tax=Streptomyces sp. N2A TaxID=3073936 RepID=UPI002870068C|nr:cellulose-binding protein [Streptomyces sp. N2A]